MVQFFRNSKYIRNAVRAMRKMVGITPEMLNHKFHIKRQSDFITQYFLSHNDTPKLQIGCQNHLMKDWLNVDLSPKSIDVMFMDATQKFPFPDESFALIYSEHMIEHIKLREAEFMIAECFRVLKKGGKIRISTPDLNFLIDLGRSEKTQTQKEYIDFSVSRYLHNETPHEDVYVINNFFKDWGHQFIHNFNSLAFQLNERGFTNIKRVRPTESDTVLFRNIERHGLEISEKFNALESLIVEAEKK